MVTNNSFKTRFRVMQVLLLTLGKILLGVRKILPMEELRGDISLDAAKG